MPPFEHILQNWNLQVNRFERTPALFSAGVDHTIKVALFKVYKGGIAFPSTSLTSELIFIGNLLLNKLKVSVLLFSDNLSFMEFLQ